MNLIAHSHFLFVFENPAQIVFRSYKEASRRLCLLWEELVGRGTGSEVRKHLTVCFINDKKLLTAASFPLAPTNASGTTCYRLPLQRRGRADKEVGTLVEGQGDYGSLGMWWYGPRAEVAE